MKPAYGTTAPLITATLIPKKSRNGHNVVQHFFILHVCYKSLNDSMMDSSFA